MTEREQFEAWWPSVGQTIGKAAAWEAWQARATPKVPEGMAIVPVEPTEEMTLAAMSAVDRRMPYITDAQKVRAIWLAMLAAAKEQS